MFGGLFEKLKEGLTKTRGGFTDRINETLVSAGSIDEDLFEEIEEILITSDIGVETSLEVINRLKEKIKLEKIKDPTLVKGCLKEVLLNLMGTKMNSIIPNKTPAVFLIIGVNGVGKTTSIGKIAYKLKNKKYKVIIAAADTFRAAAIDQLEIWTNRAGVDIIKHDEGADPAAVIFDAAQAAKARKVDVLICDTAGRLHNKKNLMEELKKVTRILDRELPNASKETLLVLDATTGQNAVSQAKVFKETAGITGIILTKLDGTAKGGIVISVKAELDVPVKLIGVGEKMDDLQPFDANDFVNALFD